MGGVGRVKGRVQEEARAGRMLRMSISPDVH